MSLIRIPVLLAILVASGPLQWRYAQQRFVFTADGAVASVPPWLALMAVAVVFILAAGYAATSVMPRCSSSVRRSSR